MPHLPVAAPRPGRAGFSLIELLITITLVGILALFTIPRFGAVMGEQNVSRAAQAVASDLTVATSIAQRDRKPVRIKWVSGDLRLTITNRAGTTQYRNLQVGGSEGYSLAGSQISVYPSSGMVEVYPNGLATDSVSIKFTASTGYSKRVRMTRAGLVQTF